MFLDYLWPSEMREALYKLSLSSQLNEKAVKISRSYAATILSLSLAAGLLGFVAGGLKGAMLLFTPSFLCVICDLRATYFLRYSPYLNGKIKEIKVIWLVVHLGGVYKIRCTLLSDETKQVILGAGRIHNNPIRYKTGDIIAAFIYQRGNKLYAMPDNKEYKELYCLKKCEGINHV